MRKSRLSRYKQDRLIEQFVAGMTERTASSLSGVNRKILEDKINFRKSYITMGGALFVLSACAGDVDFEWVAKMSPKGTPFQNALQKEYVELTKSEFA